MKGTRMIWDAARIEYLRWIAAIMTRAQLAEHLQVTPERVGQLEKEYLVGGREPQPDTHGMCGTKTYAVWAAMTQRCTNPNDRAYKDYGGRGITICDRWSLFSNFFTDMGVRPPSKTIDRIDVNGNYEPGNCQWATQSEQQRNKRTNVFVDWEGSRWVLADLCKHLGIYSTHIYRVVKRGLSLHEAINHLVNLKEQRHAKVFPA